MKQEACKVKYSCMIIVLHKTIKMSKLYYTDKDSNLKSGITLIT